MRERIEGTPKDWRSTRWVMPNRRNPVLWMSLAGAGLLAVILIGAYFSGVPAARHALSPGPIASQHASFAVKCSQCHEPGQAVAAVRCERCHDPAVSDRLTHAAHILLGTGDPDAMAAAQEQTCQTCHLEHRGRAASLRAVDDRECAVCHRTPTGSPLRQFADHPEFAVIRAGTTPGIGIKLDHARHLEAAKEKRGETCSVCHEQTPDRKAFVPITFDRHCVTCHTKNGFITGETESADINLVVMPANIPAAWRGDSQPRLEINPDDTVKGFDLRHRDGWILYNALRLRSGIDPEGEESERLTLRGQIGYLESLLRARSPAPAPSDQLSQAIASLESEIAGLDARLASPNAPEQDAGAITEMAESVRTLATLLQGLSPDGSAEAQALAGSRVDVAAPPVPQDGGSGAAIERRKLELAALLEAIEKRSAGTALAQRAAGLKSQVTNLSSSGGEADQAALLERLGSLESVVKSLRSVPDSGLQAEVARLDLERRYAQQRIANGLPPDDFDGRRRELLALLDQIDARAPNALRARAGVLRQRLLSVRPGSAGDAELRRAREQRQRQLDRLRLELELRASREQEPVPNQDAAVDRPAVEAAYQRARSTLALLDAAPAMEEADDETALSDRRDALRSLLNACLKCHELDPSGARIARPQLAQPVMPRSVFNHAPHVTRATCESCHGSILKSKLATEINVPGAATCATCHAPSKTRDDCATCHVYHPSSPARLIEVTR